MSSFKLQTRLNDKPIITLEVDEDWFNVYDGLTAIESLTRRKLQ